MRILIILNHEPLEEQLDELKKMGYSDFIYVKHPMINPEFEVSDVKKLFRDLANEVYVKSPYDAVWMQGDFRLFAVILEYCREAGLPLYVATTERNAVEKKMPDGSIRKMSVFKHVKFVEVA